MKLYTERTAPACVLVHVLYYKCLKNIFQLHFPQYCIFIRDVLYYSRSFAGSGLQVSRCREAAGWKGKQVKDLCELVTVNREQDVIVPLRNWEGDIYVRIYEPGDLPAGSFGSIPLPRPRVTGRICRKIQHHCVLLPMPLHMWKAFFVAVRRGKKR